MKQIKTMNLQLFAEDFESPVEDDFILLDNDPAQPQADDNNTGEETTPEPEPKPEPYKLKIKYNHEDMEIPEDEAVPLIQKGMNYDKLQERYNAIQNDPRLSKYDKVAQVSKLLGYQTEDELIDALHQTYYQTTANQRGLTPEQIKKEHELNQEREKLQNEKETAQQQRHTNAMYERFMTAYPDVQTKDIKPETWEKVKAGMDLTAAYVEQRNQELETQIKIMKQNEKNKAQAPVNGVTNHGATSTQGKDPFEMGFDSIK